MKLHELAHARAGDKGDATTLSLIPYRDEHYAHLCAVVSAQAVAAHFDGLITGAVTRHEIPGLPALCFTLEGALLGGVTISPAVDPHGKSLSFALLAMDIPPPP
ncbi:MAG: hypothetical protein JNM79_14595 [Burkholderiales bacterium]|nr:hypothetical protein [Burkholderiales bacterium]